MHELAADCRDAIFLMVKTDQDAEIPSWLMETALSRFKHTETCG